MTVEENQMTLKKQNGPQSPTAANGNGVAKTPTRIQGLDEILRGGLPAGRVTLIAGGPGTGKTVFGVEFLYRGALADEPGIFFSFEESAENIRRNMRSFGWDLDALEKAGKLALIEGRIDMEAIRSGDFNLKGLLAIMAGKSKQMGAKRLVIDALDMLLQVFDEPRQERRQVLMLHQWLNQAGLTAVLTAKNPKDNGTCPPHGSLDYMADCVIYLDQRVMAQVSTKRFQVIKYRGSGYDSNEYPFLITDHGVFFHSISGMELTYAASAERLSTGVPGLDAISGGGYQRRTCILIAGATGTGKTSIASAFARSACEDGHKVLYLNFEESRDNLVAGMRSIGLDLGPLIERGALRVVSAMPESAGIEEHLYAITDEVRRFRPDHIVVDTISASKRIAGERASFDFLMRLIHFCRQSGMTVLLLNQSLPGESGQEISGIGISSVIDTVIALYYRNHEDETRRVLHIMKSRGSNHSNRFHPFALTDHGIELDPATASLKRTSTRQAPEMQALKEEKPEK